MRADRVVQVGQDYQVPRIRPKSFFSILLISQFWPNQQPPVRSARAAAPCPPVWPGPRPQGAPPARLPPRRLRSGGSGAPPSGASRPPGTQPRAALPATSSPPVSRPMLPVPVPAPCGRPRGPTGNGQPQPAPLRQGARQVCYCPKIPNAIANFCPIFTDSVILGLVLLPQSPPIYS
jgi:hypothetical protein